MTAICIVKVLTGPRIEASRYMTVINTSQTIISCPSCIYMKGKYIHAHLFRLIKHKKSHIILLSDWYCHTCNLSLFYMARTNLVDTVCYLEHHRHNVFYLVDRTLCNLLHNSFQDSGHRTRY